jgi:hypothetical protein
MDGCAIPEVSGMGMSMGMDDADAWGGRTKYTTSATTAIVITVNEMFSMQNTPGGHRFAGMRSTREKSGFKL